MNTSFGEDGYVVVDDLVAGEGCAAAVAGVEQAAFELALDDPADGPLSYRPMLHLTSPARRRRRRRALGADRAAPPRHVAGAGGVRDARPRSALSGTFLDDRLLVAGGGAWLDEPVRQRELDLLSLLANYDGR